MDSEEYSKLQAYYTLEPRGEELAKLEHAFTRYTIASSFGGSEGLTFEQFQSERLYKVETDEEKREKQDIELKKMELEAKHQARLTKVAANKREKKLKDKVKDVVDYSI